MKSIRIQLDALIIPAMKQMIPMYEFLRFYIIAQAMYFPVYQHMCVKLRANILNSNVVIWVLCS